MASSRILVGVVVGAQGLRGVLRVKSFTAVPTDIAAYGPLEDEAGTARLKLTIVGEKGNIVLARAEGVEDRNAAEALAGTKLHVERSVLPATEPDEYYHADLIGLRAELADGSVIGTVTGFHDFGGGELIAITGIEDKGESLLPFSLAVVPVVDIAGGRIVVDPPVEIDAKADEGGGDEAHEAA